MFVVNPFVRYALIDDARDTSESGEAVSVENATSFQLAVLLSGKPGE